MHPLIIERKTLEILKHNLKSVGNLSFFPICLEFFACQLAESPHPLWLQSPAQNFPFSTGISTNVSRPWCVCVGRGKFLFTSVYLREWCVLAHWVFLTGRFALYQSHPLWLLLLLLYEKMWVYVMISVRPASQFFICGKNVNVAIFSDLYDKCLTLHDGSTHWFLPIHSTFSDFDRISRSQQCQTVLNENFMFFSD